MDESFAAEIDDLKMSKLKHCIGEVFHFMRPVVSYFIFFKSNSGSHLISLATMAATEKYFEILFMKIYMILPVHT